MSSSSTAISHGFTAIDARIVLRPTPPPCPPLSPPPYRLNLLAAHDDILYIPASPNEITRLCIRRSNGPQLLNLPSVTIAPPTVVNNVRVAPFSFPPSTHSLVLTAGSEQNPNSGKLVFLPLPSYSASLKLAPPVARSYSTRTHSAWGLAIHPFLAQIAISTNSFRSVVYSFRPSYSSPRPRLLHPDDPQQIPLVHVSPPITAPPADVDQLHALFYEHRFLLRQLHRNNLPCVSFHRHGDMLACASIDCTFSVQSLQSSFRPWVYQSDQPVSSNFNYSRMRERCWQTHWILPSTVQYVSKEDDVWKFQSFQRKIRHSWDLTLSPMASIPSIFNRHDYAVRRMQTKVFYDDNQLLEDSSQSHPTTLPSHSVSFQELENAFDVSSFFDKPTESQRQASVYTINPKPFYAKKAPVFAPDELDSYAQGHLLLVCYERKLELHHVPVNRDCNAMNECSAPDVQKLDTMSLDATLGFQIMFTNVIEVAPLSLLVCTAIDTGILLVRILRATSESSIDKPSLLIERVISMNIAVAGTCVIERPGDNIAEFCAELWIFTIDGCLQCWELSQDGYAIDISTPL
ncbi:unnamed protein product [Agarophyton chilense]